MEFFVAFLNGDDNVKDGILDPETCAICLNNETSNNLYVKLDCDHEF